MNDMDRLRTPIDEEDAEFMRYYDIGKRDQARIQALTARKVDNIAIVLVDHCKKPAHAAHPVRGRGFWGWAEHNKFMITIMMLVTLVTISGGVEAAKIIWGL